MIDIITGDCKELALAIPDHSIDLIFTDPPYPGEYLHLYQWLAIESPRILKLDGFLLTYVGPYHKDTVMSYMRDTLEYFWDYIDYNTANSTIIWPRNTISRYKSIIAYRQKGSPAKPKAHVLGVLPGMGADKRYHEWGQPEHTARYFIDYFSDEGDTILDPFVGGGTTAAVCKFRNRNCLAFEIDPTMAEIARSRLDGIRQMEFSLDEKQIGMGI